MYRCSKPASLQCPKCVELALPKEASVFCSQECFKARCSLAARLLLPPSTTCCCRVGLGYSGRRVVCVCVCKWNDNIGEGVARWGSFKQRNTAPSTHLAEPPAEGLTGPRAPIAVLSAAGGVEGAQGRPQGSVAVLYQ